MLGRFSLGHLLLLQRFGLGYGVLLLVVIVGDVNVVVIIIPEKSMSSLVLLEVTVRRRKGRSLRLAVGGDSIGSLPLAEELVAAPTKWGDALLAWRGSGLGKSPGAPGVERAGWDDTGAGVEQRSEVGTSCEP